MAGCFGDHPVDQWKEQWLNDDLDRINRELDEEEDEEFISEEEE